MVSILDVRLRHIIPEYFRSPEKILVYESPFGEADAGPGDEQVHEQRKQDQKTGSIYNAEIFLLGTEKNDQSKGQYQRNAGRPFSGMKSLIRKHVVDAVTTANIFRLR